MSNHISYDDAIIQLIEMFPKMDVEVIRAMLNDNNRNMEQTIASLLILSGDESPELVKTVKKGTEFSVSSETEEDLLDIEREYGIDLHKTWHTHVPQDLLVFHYRQPQQNSSTSNQNGELTYSNASAYMRGPGLIYYNPGDIYGASFGLSEFGRSIKDKFKNYLNKRKGYQLTKTTEDFIVCLTNIEHVFIIKVILTRIST